ncbi:hypothetical protein ATZ36_17875 [Candidatus Endomicrobiellum trichonymphae]|uniref:UvrD-like helicase ATP-binding domain-containing protein n=1 Tax=Endomicrobium trichonymphae TaxID=1408204 RepID=A0A1E5IKA1_ENDTX|nr:hypothetical protein ATZ36_17875 [Candidatus Endomicrobium trichonymphae]
MVKSCVKVFSENEQKFLLQNENVLERVRSRFQYIMVDEFQDTNPLQIALLHLLCPSMKK